MADLLFSEENQGKYSTQTETRNTEKLKNKEKEKKKEKKEKKKGKLKMKKKKKEKNFRKRGGQTTKHNNLGNKLLSIAMILY